MPVQSDIARFLRRQAVSQPQTLMANSGSVAPHPSCERRHSGQGRCPELQHTDTANNRGVGEWEPRGAAAGAALNRSRRSAYEPSPDPQRPPEPRNEGSPTPRFGPASRSRDGEGEVHTDSNHSTTMARSLGSSMARGLGILLIMMTLSEIAATRARPAYHNKGLLPPPIETAPRAPPPLQNARRWRRRTSRSSERPRAGRPP